MLFSEVIEECSSDLLLTGPSAMFTSLDSDNDGFYDANLACLWTIEATDTQIVKLHIDSIYIQGDDACSFDFLEVHCTQYHGNTCLLRNYYTFKKVPEWFNTSVSVLKRVRWRSFITNWSFCVIYPWTTTWTLSNCCLVEYIDIVNNVLNNIIIWRRVWEWNNVMQYIQKQNTSGLQILGKHNGVHNNVMNIMTKL